MSWPGRCWQIAEQNKKIRERTQQARRYRRLSAVAMAFGMLMLIAAIGAAWAYRDANMQKARILAMRADKAIDEGDTRTGLLRLDELRAALR